MWFVVPNGFWKQGQYKSRIRAGKDWTGVHHNARDDSKVPVNDHGLAKVLNS
jgi:hypothetical protein